MKTSTMKTIDHYLGIPVCLFLDIVQRLREIFPRQHVRVYRRILVMKFFGMGTILLASPMLRAIKARHPDATIGFLTFESNRDIVMRLGLVDEVYTLRTGTLRQFAGDLLRSIRVIRRSRYDVTIDMEFFSKFSTIITYLSGSPVRIGYFMRQLWRGDLLTEQIYYNHFKHITEVIGALAVPLDVRITDGTIQRPMISSSDLERASELLTSEGVDSNELLIAFNVNVSDLSLERRWPKEHFQQLAAALLLELDARLLFVGGAGDISYVNEVIAPFAGNDRVIALAGKTSLGELLGVMTHCDLFITNDSGPLHLAASLGLPTVSFFGPETPVLYGPRGGDTLIFHEELYCSPCLNVFNVKTAPCAGRNLCLSAIKVDTVLTSIRSHFASLWELHGTVTRRAAGKGN